MSGALTPIILSGNGRGVALACTDASGTTRRALIGNGDSLVVTNIGSFVGFLAIGDLTVTAVAPGSEASYPIIVGTKEDQIVLDRNKDSYARAPYVAGVCKAGETTTLVVHLVQR